jgi:hypothetical protein
MDESLHKKLIKDIDILKSKVRKYSSSALTGSVAVELRKQFFPDARESKLISPARQSFYLLGIMLTTPEPSNPQNLSAQAIDKIFGLLNKIFQAYEWMFWPSKKDKDRLTDEWYRCREVAMPVFLHYFNSSLLATVEQIKQRVIDYVQPFDNVLIAEIGLSSSEVIEIIDNIAAIQQKKLDELYDLAEREREIRQGLLEQAQAEDWDLTRLKQETASSEYADLLPMFISKMDTRFSIEKSLLVGEEQKVDDFLVMFSSKRTGDEEYVYITEDNPAEKYPLFEYDIDKYFCPSLNALYIAALNSLEDILLESDKKDSFLKSRDKTLEKVGANIFARLLGEDSLCFCELYETKELQYEHDILIVSNRHLYIIEAKASPPLEPFRDPEKAYKRLKRHFKSSRGIQKGFEQALRIQKKLQEQGKLSFYNEKAEQVVEFKSEDFDKIFCICLTRDDFGPIATNLNFLLEKDDTDLYPWVINIYDLESLEEGFRNLGLEEPDLARYIENRIHLHGKIFGTDELEYVGFFIKHGGLEQLRQVEADMVVLEPRYSDIFDEIYFANKFEEEAEVKVTEPVLADFRDELKAALEIQRKKSEDLKERRADEKKKRKKKMQKQSRKRNRS